MSRHPDSPAFYLQVLDTKPRNANSKAEVTRASPLLHCRVWCLPHSDCAWLSLASRNSMAASPGTVFLRQYFHYLGCIYMSVFYFESLCGVAGPRHGVGTTSHVCSLLLHIPSVFSL